MDMERYIVKKEDWKTHEMPEACVNYEMECFFSKEQEEALKFGHRPKTMDDHWFAYYEGSRFYIHGSWSGFCIFIIEVDETASTFHVTANRDRRQYNYESHKNGIEGERELITHLLKRFIGEGIRKQRLAKKD